MLSYHCKYKDCTDTFGRVGDYTRHVRRFHWKGRNGVLEIARQRVLEGSHEEAEAHVLLETTADEGYIEVLEDIQPMTFPVEDNRFVIAPQSSPPPSEEGLDGDATGEESDEPPTDTIEQFAEPLAMFPVLSRDITRNCAGTNPWTPFASKEDFWFAWWSRQNPSLSKSRINDFLRMLRDDTFDIRKVTFTSADKVMEKADELVKHENIVPWQQGSITISGSTNENLNGLTVTFLYRDVLQVIKNLFAREDLDIVLRPKQELDGDGLRIFNEPWTGDRWARYQVMFWFMNMYCGRPNGSVQICSVQLTRRPCWPRS
jgi:hypothetical protein